MNFGHFWECQEPMESGEAEPSGNARERKTKENQENNTQRKTKTNRKKTTKKDTGSGTMAPGNRMRENMLSMQGRHIFPFFS